MTIDLLETITASQAWAIAVGAALGGITAGAAAAVWIFTKEDSSAGERQVKKRCVY